MRISLFFLSTIFLLLLNSMLMSAQGVLGTWTFSNNAQASITFTEGELQNVYTMILPNGQQFSNHYWQKGATLYLYGYNNGTDVSFSITAFDGKNLMLEEQFSSNGFNYQLIKKGAKVNGNLEQIVQQQLKNKSKRYKLNSTKVLGTVQGQNYTEGHFHTGLRFVEFIVGSKITESEKQAGLKEALTEFKKNPTVTLQSLQQTKKDMKAVYNLSDPTQIAIARNSLLAFLHKNRLKAQASGEKMPYMFNLIDKYTPILAIDMKNGLVLTKRDVDGLFKLATFSAKLSNQRLSISEAEKRQAQQELTAAFPSASLDEKQSLAIIADVYDILKASYEQMNPTQQQAFRNQLSGQGGNNATNGNLGNQSQAEIMARLNGKKMDASFWQNMSNMSLQNHVGMLNSINALGGSNDYWSIKYH